MVFWAGEGEEGRGNGFPVSPRSDPRPGTHTAHTYSPPRVAAATAEYRQDCHYHTAARGDRRQRSSVLRFLSVPHPHCDALHAVGLKLGWGRVRRNATIPSTTYPQGAPLPWPAVCSTTARRRKKGDTQPDMLLGYNSAICVQKFNDSRKSAIHTTFRALLRSSSTHEPRDPLFRVVFWFLVVFFRALLCSAAREKEIVLWYTWVVKKRGGAVWLFGMEW